MSYTALAMGLNTPTLNGTRFSGLLSKATKDRDDKQVTQLFGEQLPPIFDHVRLCKVNDGNDGDADTFQANILAGKTSDMGTMRIYDVSHIKLPIEGQTEGDSKPVFVLTKVTEPWGNERNSRDRQDARTTISLDTRTEPPTASYFRELRNPNSNNEENRKWREEESFSSQHTDAVAAAKAFFEQLCAKIKGLVAEKPETIHLGTKELPI